jgi:hypothetical protein
MDIRVMMRMILWLGIVLVLFWYESVYDPLRTWYLLTVWYVL